MAKILICVRHGDTIFDYAIFGRYYVPVNFEEYMIGLAMRHDPCSKYTQYFYIRAVPYIVEKHHQHCQAVSTTPRFYIGTEDICQCNQGNPIQKKIHKLSLIQLSAQHRRRFRFPSNLAYCCFEEIKRCRRFRRNFIRYIKKRFKFKNSWKWVCSCVLDDSVCSHSFPLPVLMEICTIPVPADVCYAWCYRVEGLVVKRYILEETMAWLSTLGGGFSSLGDYFLHFSEEAGKLSVTQLRIAMEMGDPIMAAKCRLFFSLSLMQRGQLRDSKRFIRRQYYFATHHRIRDQRLIDMCLGMWSKLQHLYAVRRRSLSAGGSHNNSSSNHSNSHAEPRSETCRQGNISFSVESEAVGTKLCERTSQDNHSKT